MNDNAQLTIDHFSTALEIVIYTRPVGTVDWIEFDRGPGYFNIPDGHETAVRIQNIDDRILQQLVNDLAGCSSLRYLNLSENRKITNRGIAMLNGLPQVTMLNLSSCDLTNEGLEPLASLPRLTWLNISYCNRLNNDAVPYLRNISRLTYLDLDGVLKLNKAGQRRIERKNLKINR